MMKVESFVDYEYEKYDHCLSKVDEARYQELWNTEMVPACDEWDEAHPDQGFCMETLMAAVIEQFAVQTHYQPAHWTDIDWDDVAKWDLGNEWLGAKIGGLGGAAYQFYTWYSQTYPDRTQVL